MKNNKLQVAVIGCGGIANQKHFPALKSQADKCEMVAFCDILIERAEKAAKEYGSADAKVYQDYNELLKDENIDVAVPVPDDGAKGCIQQVESSPWMGIYKQSKHPKEAGEYLMALFSEDYGYQSGCVSDGNYVSIVPSVNEKYMTNEVMKQYYEIASETAKVVPVATTRDEKAYDFYAEVKDVQPSLGAILQGVLSQSITDYSSELTKLAEASTTEWKRASEAVGLDYATFDFPNWDPLKDYTEADYAALK